MGGDTIATVPRLAHPVGICVEDPQVRRQAGPQNLFKVRLANSEARRESASYLIERRYAWRGYAVNSATCPAPNRITIAAHDEENIVATVTIGLDSSEGLFIDGLYAPEANRLRVQGRRIAEFTKLAVDNNAHSKPLLAALFHIAYICARRIHRCTDLLIEVNPRHVAFYRRMLGFEQFGEARTDPRIGAPAVLLKLCLAHAQAEIARLGGNIHAAAAGRSLYPYFFAASEELSVERRLRALG
jgi:N-acyl amino acid synthase FeeM